MPGIQSRQNQREAYEDKEASVQELPDPFYP